MSSVYCDYANTLKVYDTKVSDEYESVRFTIEGAYGYVDRSVDVRIASALMIMYLWGRETAFDEMREKEKHQ